MIILRTPNLMKALLKKRNRLYSWLTKPNENISRKISREIRIKPVILFRLRPQVAQQLTENINRTVIHFLYFCERLLSNTLGASPFEI